jgi:2-polyprenyl-3-methyl-5-hydroxy-6-metoxy-1,4-benzoquinol methylase
MDAAVRFITRSSCDLCGAKKKEALLAVNFCDPAIFDFLESYYQGRIAKSVLTGAQYELVKCTVCGFIWQTQILNDPGMAKLYGDWISSEDSLKKKQGASLSLYAGYAREVKAIPHLLGRKYPFDVKVVDYGMGWGRWCLTAKSFGLNVVGVDLSDERIRLGRQNGIEVVRDATELTPATVDFINAEQVFEHVPHPRKTLETLLESLTPGGVIRISVPNGRRIEARVRNPAWKAAKDAAHPLEHINIFTNRSLKQLGQRVGMKVIGHPFLLSGRRGLRSYIRGILGKYYQECLGTCLYFRKAG